MECSSMDGLATCVLLYTYYCREKNGGIYNIYSSFAACTWYVFSLNFDFRSSSANFHVKCFRLLKKAICVCACMKEEGELVLLCSYTFDFALHFRNCRIF